VCEETSLKIGKPAMMTGHFNRLRDMKIGALQ